MVDLARIELASEIKLHRLIHAYLWGVAGAIITRSASTTQSSSD